MIRRLLCMGLTALLICLAMAGVAAAEGRTYLLEEDVACLECGRAMDYETNEQTHILYCVNSSCDEFWVQNPEPHYASCVDNTVCGVCGYPCDSAGVDHVYRGGEYYYNEDVHWQACVLCGYNDEWNSTRGEHLALCGANVCMDCGMTGDIPYTHYWADGYSVNETEHYKQCLGCGEITYSAAHQYIGGLRVNPDDPTVHGYWCSGCGYVSNEGIHTDTCQEPDVCQECGYESEGMAGGHLWSTGSYETDDTYHWHICVTCGEQINKGEHALEYAYDENEHWQTCTVCGIETGRGTHMRDCLDEGRVCAQCGVTSELCEGVGIITTHNPADEYEYDGISHYHVCLDCGGEVDSESHEYLDEYLITETEHQQECGTCGHILGFEHQADCQNPGVCTECGYTSADITIMHSWNPLSVQYDESEHWYYCSACGDEMYRAEHSTTEGYQYDSSAHWMQCDYCSTEYDRKAHSRYCTEEVCMDCGASGDVEFVIIHEEANEYLYNETERYKVCQLCGEYLRGKTHEFDSNLTVDPDNPGYHGYRCTNCGYYGSRTAHIATCLEPGVCKECGYVDESIASSHSWNPLKIQTDSSCHWYDCLTCGGQIYKEEHKRPCTGDTSVCETCGIAYTGSNYSHNSLEVVYDDEQHWNACADCGEALNHENHTYVSYLTTNPNDASMHGYMCSWCDYFANVGEHVASCANTENCRACGYAGTDMPVEHEDMQMVSNASYHWEVCQTCGVEQEKSKHTFGYAYDDGDHWLACTACGIGYEHEAHTRGCAESVCAVCSAPYTGENLTHGDTETGWDAQNHWTVCVDCGVKLSEEAHGSSKAYSSACDGCALLIGEAQTAVGALDYTCTLEEITEESFTFSIKATASEHGVFSEYGCKVVDLNTGDVKTDYVNTSDSNLNIANATVFEINSWKLAGEAGHTYSMQLHFVFNGETCFSPVYLLVFQGTRLPFITDTAISDVTPDGYTISCNVVSEEDVESVQFHAWNSYAADGNVQDDLTVHEGIKEGEKWTCRISVSDGHMDQTNCTYYTDVAAYDVSGNACEAHGYTAECRIDLAEYDTLTLPASTVHVEREALSGIPAEVVIVPQSCESIGTRAFADCPNLTYVILALDGQPEIAADAFEGSDAAVLRCE